eukprot:CAMPEP_0172626342 /NCGR_PEP_ID=MMETSP1068-20121228/149771_1 /TAXON_ID=35684 /ORGANISM="Pseudopedinella elastica, Strain CCMP716" /LENGTH=441 /DNA_ID=CAMNT_0013435933 /DNA_START=321 /DNA_END=1646 /DNA_ORIENTATION=+
MLLTTACYVEMFQCGSEATSKHIFERFPGRLRFHPFCAGGEAGESTKQLLTWLSMANASSSHRGVRSQILVLKMDVEIDMALGLLSQIAALRAQATKKSVQIDGATHFSENPLHIFAPLQLSVGLSATGGQKVISSERAQRDLGFVRINSSQLSLEIEPSGYQLVDRQGSPECVHCPSRLLFAHNSLLGENNHADLYSVGDRFHMPSFVSGPSELWTKKVFREALRTSRGRIAKALPGSLLGHYSALEAAATQGNCSSFKSKLPLCPGFPSVSLLRAALDDLGRRPGRVLHAFEAIHALEATLLVHLRSGDMRFDDDAHLEALAQVVAKGRFRHVRVLGAAHGDTRYGDPREFAKNYLETFSKARHAMGQCNVTYHVSISPDDDLYQIYISRHFFAHHGGFSMAGSLVTRGTVYTRAAFLESKEPGFLELLRDGSRNLVVM